MIVDSASWCNQFTSRCIPPYCIVLVRTLLFTFINFMCTIQPFDFHLPKAYMQFQAPIAYLIICSLQLRLVAHIGRHYWPRYASLLLSNCIQWACVISPLVCMQYGAEPGSAIWNRSWLANLEWNLGTKNNSRKTTLFALSAWLSSDREFGL